MPQDATKRPAPYLGSPRSGVIEPPVIGPAFGTTLAGVLPVAAVTANPITTAAAFVALYPYCHLFFRWRRWNNNNTTRRNKQ